jgi:DNA-binding transcriptional ArsR family regulator
MNIQARQHLCKIDTLGSTSKAILLTLLTYCHGDKDCCFPSIGDMAKISGYVKRTIRKHLRILEQAKYIETTKEKERKSNTYRILGLYSGRMDSGTVFPQSSNPEGLKENTYAPTDGRFDGRKPSKTLRVCDLDQSIKGQSQKKTAIESVAEGQSQKKTAIESVAEGQSQKKTAIESVAEGQSQKKASFRFEGPLTTQKTIEIYNVFTRYGWIRKSYHSFFTFIANCSMAKRLRKKNPFGWITWVYKNKFDRKLITATDEKLAMNELKLIQNMGIMPDFTEAQRYQATPPEAPPPARISSRPAMDWPERNLPETGKEAALHKKVKCQQLSHVHPRWFESLNCWIAKSSLVDGKMRYETHPLTEDGWYKIGLNSEIVALKNPQGNQISKEELIRLLADGFLAQ